MKFEAEAKDLPERFVACAHHVGPYNEIGKALEKIFAWAGPKGLIQSPKAQCLGIYHDDPQKVDPSELRSEACLTVPEGTEGDGDVSTMKIPGGLFAVAHIEIDPSEYGAAWDKLVGEWLPENGYVSDQSRMCYELYLNDPDQHPEKKHIVDLCEPVKRG
jgi:AraC family transcriptional regulator